VLVAEKGGKKEQTGELAFFTLPDGKHIISNAVLPFGARPFDGNRELLQAQANGPWYGASSKQLEFVEFADFECPHCKEAQETMRKLAADYPQAHIVFENYPLVTVHPEAFKAAAYGVCVAKLSGNEAFFQYTDAVFTSQAELTPGAADQTLASAVTKAGADPAKVAACAATPAAKAEVNAQISLGNEVGVDSTPSLFINGRNVPISAMPYEVAKKIIAFQAELDGITLPPPAPEKPAPSLK
jgi:protein-disulfide isomerase